MIDEKALDKELRLAQLAAVGFLIQILMLGYVAVSGSKNWVATHGETPGGGFDFLKYAILGFSLLLIAGIPFIRKTLLALSSKIKTPPSDGQNSMPFFAFCAVTLGLSEFPAVLGYVLFTQNHNVNDFYLCGGLAVLYLLLNYPRDEHRAQWVASRRM